MTVEKEFSRISRWLLGKNSKRRKEHVQMNLVSSRTPVETGQSRGKSQMKNMSETENDACCASRLKLDALLFQPLSQSCDMCLSLSTELKTSLGERARLFVHILEQGLAPCWA